MRVLANKNPLFAAVLATITVVTGCSDGTDTATAADPAASVGSTAVVPPAMATYNAPGSNWEYQFTDNGSFALSRSDHPGMTADLSVSGSFQITAAGFVSMTVAASSGSDAPSVDSQIWALEIPDYALVLSPVSTSDDNFIPMVVGGQCPGSDFSNNWVTVRAQLSGDTTSADSGFFGSMSYQHTDGATSLLSQYALTSGNPDKGSMSLGNGYCREGVLGTATSDIYLAPEGSATVRANVDDIDSEQMIFSLPKKTIGSITGLDGSYVGLISDDGADTADKVLPIIVNCSSGTCTADVVIDVDAGTMAGQPFVVDLSGSINVPSPGLTTGQLFMNGGSTNVGCMVDENNDNVGNRMISCAGQSPTRDYRLFNMILMSND